MSRNLPKPKIGVIGTCRVHKPIQVAERAGRLDRKADKAFGFMHTPHEILQSLSILRRKVDYPVDFPELLSLEEPDELAGDEDLVDSRFSDIDVLVLELSAMRYIRYSDWYLQINRLSGRLKSIGITEDPHLAAFKNKIPEPALLEKIRNLDPILSDIIEKGQFLNYTKEEFKDAVSQIILEIGKPTLLVGHFVEIEPFATGAIRQRALIREALNEVAFEMTGVQFFDPTLLIKEFGVEKALKDSSHYLDDFNENAGDRILQACTSIMGQSVSSTRARLI